MTVRTREVTVHNLYMGIKGRDAFANNHNTADTQSITGWARGIQPGDVVVLRGKSDNSMAVMSIESIRYQTNPSDMFHAVARWIGNTLTPEETHDFSEHIHDRDQTWTITVPDERSWWQRFRNKG